MKTDAERGWLIIAKPGRQRDGYKITAAFIFFNCLIDDGSEAETPRSLKGCPSSKGKTAAQGNQNTWMEQHIAYFTTARGCFDGRYDLAGETDLGTFPDVDADRHTYNIAIFKVGVRPTSAESNDWVDDTYVPCQLWISLGRLGKGVGGRGKG